MNAGLEPLLGDVELADLADAVRARVDALEGLVDRLQLGAIAIGQDQADVPIPLLAGQVVGVHAFVLLALAARLGLVLDVRADLLRMVSSAIRERSSGKPFMSSNSTWPRLGRHGAAEVKNPAWL